MKKFLIIFILYYFLTEFTTNGQHLASFNNKSVIIVLDTNSIIIKLFLPGKFSSQFAQEFGMKTKKKNHRIELFFDYISYKLCLDSNRAHLNALVSLKLNNADHLKYKLKLIIRNTTLKMFFEFENNHWYYFEIYDSKIYTISSETNYNTLVQNHRNRRKKICVSLINDFAVKHFLNSK